MASRHIAVRMRLSALVIGLAACSDRREPTGRAVLAQTVSPWSIINANDFNGDGLADLLWSDPAAGRTAISLMWGEHLLEAGPVTYGPPGPGWSVVTAEDFNFDGMADLVWFDADNRRGEVWLMRGTHVVERGPEIAGPTDGTWSVAYVGDFNGGGIADLLWHNGARSRSAVWVMNGTEVQSRGPELPAPHGNTWIVPSTGDFNLDSTFDVLWYDTAHHTITVWLMWGTGILEQGPELPGPGPGYIAVSAADFNADGTQDVIWNDPAQNLMAVWLMWGTHVLARGPLIPGPPGDGWVVGTAGDTDGDGMADTIWYNTRTNRFTVWKMAGGTTVLGHGPEIPGPPP